jgi:hypothetical protein
MTRVRTQETFRIAHITFVVTDCPNQGTTFGLYAGDDGLPERRTRLFSGHIEDGMTTGLHRLAAHISTFEHKKGVK